MFPCEKPLLCRRGFALHGDSSFRKAPVCGGILTGKKTDGTVCTGDSTVSFSIHRTASDLYHIVRCAVCGNPASVTLPFVWIPAVIRLCGYAYLYIGNTSFCCVMLSYLSEPDFIRLMPSASETHPSFSLLIHFANCLLTA